MSMNARPVLAPDAELVLGIAATAIPFARTSDAEAERWLRVLRLHGEVGVALQGLGVSEVPLAESGVDGEHAHAGHPAAGAHDAVAHVTERATRIASRRGATGVATTDVLMAVMQVYGEDFERVLWTHGTDRDEVLERLGMRMPESVDG
jgi:hypothetical protein